MLIFIVDQYQKLPDCEREKPYSRNSTGYGQVFSAFTDACMMAQNVVIAMESMGLGTVYFGSILNDSEKICELLKLPELTFPVIGLGIGTRTRVRS